MSSLADDRLRGGAAISEFIGEELDRTYNLLKRGIIPGYLEDGAWISSKAALRTRHFEKVGLKPEADSQQLQFDLMKEGDDDA